MTQKTMTRDANGKITKMPGWYSWRHPSRDAHDAARERYLAEHGPRARQRKAIERGAAAQLAYDLRKAAEHNEQT